jgi:hypothetical protein
MRAEDGQNFLVFSLNEAKERLRKSEERYRHAHISKDPAEIAISLTNLQHAQRALTTIVERMQANGYDV